MPHFHYHTCLSWLFASNYHIEINIINIKINYTNKKRKKEEYTHGTVAEYNRRRNSDKIVTPSTYIHERSHFWIGTGTSIKSGGLKLALLAQISHFVRRKVY